MLSFLTKEIASLFPLFLQYNIAVCSQSTSRRRDFAEEALDALPPAQLYVLYPDRLNFMNSII